MIQGNEIRIGNEYNRKHGKGWTQTTMTEYIIGKIFTDSKDYALNDFEPIPLTPEILESCWFVKENHPNEYFWKNGNVYLSQYLNYLLYDSNAEYLWSQPIQYLHQLQNLYFVLTGTELEVNLQTEKSNRKRT